MAGVSEHELVAVDRFIGEPKRLVPVLPQWKRSSRPGEMTATWNIVDSLGIADGVLRFRMSVVHRDTPSVSAVFRKRPISRVDAAPDTECHPNPLWAAALKLAPIVCGTHIHDWTHNRAYIARTGEWELPARRRLEGQIRRIPQMLPWLAAAVGIELTSGDRLFDVPPRSQLFEG